jgi:UDP-N-acetylglucosamine 2-epimerase (non-hydrolysing)
MGLIRCCEFVMTDSGGIQEETTYLKKPCITLREETERPITLESGYNYLVGNDEKKINDAIEHINIYKSNKSNIINKNINIEFWDGKTAERIVRKIIEFNINGHT